MIRTKSPVPLTRSSRSAAKAKPDGGRPPDRARANARTLSQRASAAPPELAARRADGAEQKLVRDSYTIPKLEYAALEQLKLRSTNLRRPVKKSELLRAGIAALGAMNDKAFLAILARIPSLKTGRPKKRK
jgi:hypothetical protein